MDAIREYLGFAPSKVPTPILTYLQIPQQDLIGDPDLWEFACYGILTYLGWFAFSFVLAENLFGETSKYPDMVLRKKFDVWDEMTTGFQHMLIGKVF